MTKTFTLLLAAGTLLCATATAEAAPARFKSHVRKANTVRVDRKTALKGALKAATTANVKYLPLKETISIPGEEPGEWMVVTNAEYTYNEAGLQATMTEKDAEDPSTALRESYTYDENGMMTVKLSESSEDGGETWTNSERQVKAYDPVVTNFATENVYYHWADEWVLSYGNKYPVTRNADGIVISAARQAPYQGDTFADIVKLKNTVSEDGKTIVALELTEMNADMGWDEILDIRDIVWHNTDGQVIIFEEDELGSGANRIASGKSYYGGELEASITGTYANDFEGKIRFDFRDGSWLEMTTEYTDQATGSYIETYETSYFGEPGEDGDLNGDGVIDDNDRMLTVETETYEVTYDSHGNLTKEKSTFSVNDELEYEGGIINEYVYNADGAMTQYTAYSYEGEDEPMAELRVDVIEFTTLSGLKDVVAESAPAISMQGRTLGINARGASACTVIALDGKTVAAAAGEGSYTVALDNLASGIYIARVTSGNNTVTGKIAIR